MPRYVDHLTGEIFDTPSRLGYGHDDRARGGRGNGSGGGYNADKAADRREAFSERQQQARFAHSRSLQQERFSENRAVAERRNEAARDMAVWRGRLATEQPSASVFAGKVAPKHRVRPGNLRGAYGEGFTKGLVKVGLGAVGLGKVLRDRRDRQAGGRPVSLEQAARSVTPSQKTLEGR